MPAHTILHTGVLASCVVAKAVMLMLDEEFHLLW